MQEIEWERKRKGLTKYKINNYSKIGIRSCSHQRAAWS